MRISLDGKKPQGEWASFNEACKPTTGDGSNLVFETPFVAREMRGLHVMRDYLIIPPDNLFRVTDTDGKLVRDEPDGYTITAADPDKPVLITFQKPPRLGQRVSCSVLGRKPPEGEAFKVLPMTDPIAKSLDAKIPDALKKRKREDIVSVPAAQDMLRDTFQQLVVDLHGFLNDETGEALICDEATKKAILNQLGSFVLGPFVRDRATVIQNERTSGLESDVAN